MKSSTQLPTTTFWRTAAIIVGAAIAAHALLWLDAPLWSQFIAALLITAWLPGFVLARLLLGAPANEFEWLELPLFAVGAGFGVQVVGMTLLSYLPGGIAPWQILLTFDGVTLALLATSWWLERTGRETAPQVAAPAAGRRLWLAVVAVVLVGAALRFTDLGYSEFHTDEARILVLMAQAGEGYPNALMANYKGPAQVVIPGAAWLLAGRIDEATARLPFAAANLAGLLATLALGWRLFGGVAGVSAALLMAVNGYMIAFSRFLQYQSIVFLASLLVILLLWLVLQGVGRGDTTGLVRRLTLGSFLFATSLLAHYDAAGIALAAAFLLWQLHAAGLPWAKWLRALVAPAAVGGAAVALFYIPFALYPGFGAAYTYTVDFRIGGSFPYNNLVDFFQRASLYNGSYYLLFLIAVTAGYLIVLLTRRLTGVWVWLVGSAVVAGVALAFWQPESIQFLGHDWMWLVFAAPIVAVWLLPGITLAERTVWLWFGSMVLFALFIVALPRTHVYVFFMPWALVVGAGLGQLAAWLRRKVSAPALAATGGVAAVVLTGVFGYYVYQVLVRTDVEVLRTWHVNKPAGYWHPFDEPTDVGIYGFPLRNGWKAVGAAYARGELEGKFRTNALAYVAEWYLAGQGVCPRNDRYFALASTVETTDDGYQDALRREISQEYSPLASVVVNGQPRLEFFSRDAQGEPVQWDDAAAAQVFDAQLATPQRGGYRGRVLTAAPAQTTDFRLGDDQIQLAGYTLDRPVAAPGEEIEVTLYWRALAPIYQPYTVFTQLIDPATNGKIGQLDGQPVCDWFPTEQWNPGDLIADPYQIDIAPDAAPGEYQLLVGMYDATTGQRLPVAAADGAPLGDAIPLPGITVER
jgi:hypothetical protein